MSRVIVFRYFAPEIEIEFLSHDELPLGVYCALTKAIQAFNPNWQSGFCAPMTPEVDDRKQIVAVADGL